MSDTEASTAVVRLRSPKSTHFRRRNSCPAVRELLAPMAAPARSASSFSWHRASLCQTAGIFPVPLSLFVPQLSPRCTHSPAPSSDFFFKNSPPPLTSPVHPSPAGIVLGSGVKWCGGREGWRAGHLTVRSLPCWHDPPPVRAHRLQYQQRCSLLSVVRR